MFLNKLNYCNLFKENNFKIAKSKFYSEYKQRIARTSTVKNVTERTLYRDYKHIKELIKSNYNIDFEFYSSSKTKKNNYLKNIPFIDPFHLMERHLFQIRFVIGNYQSIIFSKDNNTFQNSAFPKQIMNSIEENFMKKIYTDNKNDEKDSLLKNEYMVHLYLNFNTDAPLGIEKNYCTIYENYCKEYDYYLLYTDDKNRCSEIVCTYGNLPQVLNFTFLIFSKYWRQQF